MDLELEKLEFEKCASEYKTWADQLGKNSERWHPIAWAAWQAAWYWTAPPSAEHLSLIKMSDP